MPPPVNTGYAGPSTVDKMKMGALMGGTVGVIIGFIYGTVNIFRYGAGVNGIMRTLGQYMAASGATFGVVRSDAASSPILQEAYANARARPWLMVADKAYRRRSRDD